MSASKSPREFQYADDRARLNIAFATAYTPTTPIGTVIFDAGRREAFKDFCAQHIPKRAHTWTGWNIPIIRAKTCFSESLLAERLMVASKGLTHVKEAVRSALAETIVENRTRMIVFEQFQLLHDPIRHHEVSQIIAWINKLADETRVAWVMKGGPRCISVLSEHRKQLSPFLKEIEEE
jgi:hypothetical protein